MGLGGWGEPLFNGISRILSSSPAKKAKMHHCDKGWSVRPHCPTQARHSAALQPLISWLPEQDRFRRYGVLRTSSSVLAQKYDESKGVRPSFFALQPEALVGEGVEI